MHFLHNFSGARIRVFEQILLFFMNKSWSIQDSCFVGNVSHVSHKI